MTEEHEDINGKIATTIWLGLVTTLAFAIIGYECMNLHVPNKPIEIKQSDPEKIGKSVGKTSEAFVEGFIKGIWHGLTH